MKKTIDEKTYVKLLKAKNRICNYCETSETGNCEECDIAKTINAAVDKYGSETVILNNSTCMQDEKPTTLYHIKFTMVSNCIHETYMYIIQAENEKQADENLHQWIQANQPDMMEKNWVCRHNMIPITENEYGIVYQRLFVGDNKTCTEHDTTGKLYKIKFTTRAARGDECDHLCIMRAKNKKQAEAKLREWLSSKLPQNGYIAHYRTEMKRLTEDKYGIMYHDYSQEDQP